MGKYGPQPDRLWTPALRAAIRAASTARYAFRELERECGVSSAETHRILRKQRAGTRATAERLVAALERLAVKHREDGAAMARAARALRKALRGAR
jgi:hypothetical protein